MRRMANATERQRKGRDCLVVACERRRVFSVTGSVENKEPVTEKIRLRSQASLAAKNDLFQHYKAAKTG